MRPDPHGLAMLKMAAEGLRLSGRVGHRILRVTRTIEDLDGGETVREERIVQAIGYRSLDRAGMKG